MRLDVHMRLGADAAEISGIFGLIFDVDFFLSPANRLRIVHWSVLHVIGTLVYCSLERNRLRIVHWNVLIGTYSWAVLALVPRWEGGAG